MHVNFGVINCKLSSVLATDTNKLAIALSYARCDSELSGHQFNRNELNDNCSSDNGYKETISGESENINTNPLMSKLFESNGKISPEEEMMSFAIRVKNLNFSYNKLLTSNEKPNKILQNCSLNVIEAKIYALLGSSGCGKTTLLKCILGRLKPNSGEVRIFGYEPNTPNCSIPGIYMSSTSKIQKPYQEI